MAMLAALMGAFISTTQQLTLKTLQISYFTDSTISVIIRLISMNVVNAGHKMTCLCNDTNHFLRVYQCSISGRGEGESGESNSTWFLAVVKFSYFRSHSSACANNEFAIAIAIESILKHFGSCTNGTRIMCIFVHMRSHLISLLTVFRLFVCVCACN